MWKKTNNCVYYFKVDFKICPQLYVTNFINIWAAKFSHQDYFNLVKECNSHIKNCNSQIISQIENMLRNPDTVHTKTDFKNCNSNLKMSIESVSIHGYPLRLMLTLVKGDEELFFQEVTSRLIGIVKDLTLSQNELFEIMAQKDREIEEYKLEGGRLGLKYLKTPSFNHEEHTSKHTAYETVFGSNSLPDCTLDTRNPINGERSKLIEQEVLNEEVIKEEACNINIKKEIESQPLPEPISNEVLIKQERVKSEVSVERKKRKKFLNM